MFMTANQVDQYVVKTVEEANNVASKIRGGGLGFDSGVVATVAGIIDEIRKSGDDGLVRLVEKLDSPKINRPSELRVSVDEVEEAYRNVTKDQVFSLKTLAKQIKKIASAEMERFGTRRTISPLGFKVMERYVPFARIGAYVPGGLASYPSTVLMICLAARQAGVRDIVIATPPRKDGTIAGPTLVAANICGVKEIIKAGGAHAVAALAYGTASIKKVDVIAGPGNQYVTEAKRQVAAANAVLIDSLAGPTELLIIADKYADPVLVSEDLISQAEHGNKTMCGVVSDSASLVSKVIPRLKDLSNRPRLSQILESVLFTVLVSSKALMVEFAQAFAPEHLEIMAADCQRIGKNITRSGLVLTGDFTPCSSTDYIVGTNHVLPTGGSAKVTSGLGVQNFLKRVTSVTGSMDSLKKASRFVGTLAMMENLPNHAAAVEIRFKK
jgi:histidinol dehydrogenase